jgi:tetratricopeptide (TPR) repeat protein
MASSIEDLRQKAQQALAEGEYQQARQFYHQALGVHGDHPDLHYGLATVCFLLNDLHGAAYHFLEVTRLDPLRAGAFVNLGAVYNRLEKYDDAVAALRKGIQLDAGRAEGYYNLGVVYRQRGQMELAIQAYREATRINPRMADAHYNLANIYLEKDQVPQAIAHYRHALELRPNWEKAQRGLESALATQKPEAERSAAPGSGLTPIAGKTLDPNRLLDPNVHGTLLRDLHQMIIDVDRQGHQLLGIIQGDIDKAIRDLSNCLLFPNAIGNDLNGQIKKFDAVMTQLQQLHQALQKNMKKVRELGDQVAKV